MSYVDTIRTIMPLSLDNIIKTAKQHVPDAYQHAPWSYPGLNHGTAILQNEEQLPNRPVPDFPSKRHR